MRVRDPVERAPLLDLAEVYRTYALDLRRFALYLSGDVALADDLVAEAFARAWTVRDRVETSTVRGYLFAIVRNLFLRHRSRSRRHTSLDEHALDERPGPEAVARGQSELRVVLTALAGLPEIDRAAVLMRADEGLSYDEIAAALGITMAAAKVKVHRARLPFSVTFNSGGFQGLLLEDWTARLPVLAVATVLWVVYWRMSRRLPLP